MTEASPYIGRFAPSPTGPLHFGSLLAAVASYLEARANNGRWLLRIENIDPPREQPGASEQIVSALERYGFEWDGPLVWQRDSTEHHALALQALLDQKQAYWCKCSRRDLASAQQARVGAVYPGTCRDLGIAASSNLAVRVRTMNDAIVFDDRLQGLQSLSLEAASGDFVVWRKDGLVAYQLAVVVDDHLQQVNHIVRGVDLMDSTPRQVWLQELLGYRTPVYAHIPVAVHADGSKLSKLTGARALPLVGVEKILIEGLCALRQSPPRALLEASLEEIWQWASANWNMAALTGLTSVTANETTHLP
ncbi:MAG TPA: tRNA glutamyl-Q(34) synthetase GluQRS [Woeseiaceae bacterium]|nr:tRNA glutamyl-Q(34) synthetase GluQRS [Woeseiaceae bacterium]